MTRPNTPPATADNARLIARVEELERRLRRSGANRFEDLDDVIADYRADGQVPIYDSTLKKWVATSPAAGVDGLWEIVATGSGSRHTIRPLEALTDTGDPTDEGINWFMLDLRAPQGNSGTSGDIHQTYFYVAPGIGAGGGDIQAESYIEGKDNVMDWFFWARRRSPGWDAGSFWDAIGDDEAGKNPEAFFEVYSQASDGFIELYVDTDNVSGNDAELDLHADSDTDEAFIHAYGKNAFIKFARSGGTPSMDVAPDASLGGPEWSIGAGGSGGEGGKAFRYKTSDLDGFGLANEHTRSEPTTYTGHVIEAYDVDGNFVGWIKTYQDSF